MRINVYSQELTSEVVRISKESNTGKVYEAAQLILHSSIRLHHPPDDDDRSAVTFCGLSRPTAVRKNAAICRCGHAKSSHYQTQGPCIQCKCRCFVRG